MSSFFMTISIIFHVVSLILIVILFKRIQFKGQTNLKNTQKMLEATLAQLKAENDRLRHELIPETTKRQRHTEPTVNSIEQNQKSNKPQEFKQLLEKQIEHITDEPVQDEYELTFQGKVLQLHEQGYSKEEIAQQLNRGKTEVELVLRFHAQ